MSSTPCKSPQSHSRIPLRYGGRTSANRKRFRVSIRSRHVKGVSHACFLAFTTLTIAFVGMRLIKNLGKLSLRSWACAWERNLALVATIAVRESSSCAVFVLVFMILSGSQSANALPAFARKYGLRCSACHESWPMLNYFGQKFKDNGYQLMNDRDAPIWQNPGYWPVTFRITPIWSRESTGKVAVDPGPRRARITTIGFRFQRPGFSDRRHAGKKFLVLRCFHPPIKPGLSTLSPSWLGLTICLTAPGST